MPSPFPPSALSRPASAGALLLCLVSCGGAPAPCPQLPPSPPPTASAAPTIAASTATAVDPSGDWDLRWDRGFAGWQPPIFNGKLSIQRDGDKWTASVHFKESGSSPSFVSMRVDGDRLGIMFHVAANEDGSGQDELEFAGWVRGDHLVGEMRWGKTIAWTPCGGRRGSTSPAPKAADLKSGSVEHSLPRGELAQSGADAAALQALLEHAKSERSSAIVVVKDGKIVVEMYRDGYDGSPLMAMSASKSIVSLAVGMLVADGKLSLDTRVGSLLPDWKKDPAKSAITVRQLLAHTSGLDPSRADFSGETIRDHALKAKLVFPPGTNFQYNNGAVDFLGVVFKQAAGIPLDAYLDARLFQKLDMVGASWLKDPEGTPRGAGELQIRPVDLAKVGELMLEGGSAGGQRLVPADWVKRSVEAGQPYEEDCGLLWWREGRFAYALTEPVLRTMRELGFAAAAKNARALLGKKFATYAEYTAAIRGAVGASDAAKMTEAIMKDDHVPFVARVKDGPVTGFSARGWLGQFLVVLPEKHVVAVRMRAAESSDYEKDGGGEGGYGGFAEDVSKVFAATPGR